MKNIIISTTLLITSATLFAQTNRINHYSHSGSKNTFGVFTSNDNMGLGCGSSMYVEYEPDTVKIDTSKVEKTVPSEQPIQPPRNIRAIESRVDTTSIYNRGRK